MYETFYRFNQDPFRLSPDHRFCFAHQSFTKARAYLEYGLQRAEGFVAVTGAPGTGKSTLVEQLLVGLGSSRIVVARLESTQLKATDLLRMVAFEFKLRPEGLDKSTLLRRLQEHLATQAQAGRRALIVVDEAQDLSVDALEELRLLTNLQARGRPIIQVFLLGQEQLRRKITSPGLEQLRQRLVAASHLESMTAEETRAYLIHRLDIAGWSGEPDITGDAVEAIYRYSNGVPRLTNQVCSRLLLYGSAEQKHQLNGADAQVAIDELEGEVHPEGGRRASQVAVNRPSTTPRREPKRDVSLPELSLLSLRAEEIRRDDTDKPPIRLHLFETPPRKTNETGNQAQDQAAAVQAKAPEINRMPSTPPPTLNEPAGRGRIKVAAALLLVVALIGSGVLSLAILESQPLGESLADFSRRIVAEVQSNFAAMSPESKGRQPGGPDQ